MMTTLLIVIFITFVGLGLPDSIFGTAWPAIYGELNLPISLNGFISATVSVGTIVSSLFAAKLIQRFGTGVVTAVSTLLTAVALVGYAYTKNPLTFFLFAIPLGLGAGAIDTGLNGFVAMHYNASHMSFLHCSYGVGVALSPFIMSLALGENGDWRKGYFIVSCIQIALTVLTFAALPLWKKAEKKTAETLEVEQKALSMKELFKMRGVRIACLAFFFSCSLELTVGTWSSSYFVGAKGFSESSAARFTMLYYIGFTLGRFLSGLFTTKIGRRKLLKICIGILGVSLLLFSLPLPMFVAIVGLFLTGFSVGPLYPNMMHLTPKFFGDEIAQSVIGVEQACASTGILVAPLLFGLLAQNTSVAVMPIFLIVMFLLFVYFFFSLLKESKEKKK